ncbi:hypothetical protein DL771_012146 [Monosporascus sp. 5C6A]|nr:hypothetical protein DL771_012146 [Monosporascus sp. 5C6A]
MSDPLSTVANVLAVTKAAFVSAKALWDFIDGLRNAPSLVKALNADIASAQQVLDGLQSSLKGENAYVLAPLFEQFGIEAAVDANKKILVDFRNTIEKYTTHSMTDGFSKRDRLRVTFRKSKLEAFRVCLNASRDTIKYSTTAAVLAVSTSNGRSADELKVMLVQQQDALASQSRKLSTIEKGMQDLAVDDAAGEDPEEDVIPITASQRDLILEVVPILRNVCARALVVMETRINGTFQDIEKMSADVGSRIQAGTAGENLDKGMLKQRIGVVEAKNSSGIFVGKMSNAAFKDFWGQSLSGNPNRGSFSHNW